MMIQIFAVLLSAIRMFSDWKQLIQEIQEKSVFKDSEIEKERQCTCFNERENYQSLINGILIL